MACLRETARACASGLPPCCTISTWPRCSRPSCRASGACSNGGGWETGDEDAGAPDGGAEDDAGTGRPGGGVRAGDLCAGRPGGPARPSTAGRCREQDEVPPTARHHARQEGFDLHAGVRVAADARERLERLCRYALRPPMAQDRLRLTAGGAGRLAPPAPVVGWHDAPRVRSRRTPGAPRGPDPAAAHQPRSLRITASWGREPRGDRLSSASGTPPTPPPPPHRRPRRASTAASPDPPNPIRPIAASGDRPARVPGCGPS